MSSRKERSVVTSGVLDEKELDSLAAIPLSALAGEVALFGTETA